MLTPLQTYFPIAVALLVAVGLAAVMLALANVLGPRRPSAVKSAPFECGSEPIGSARERFGVKFYVVALLFIVFDIEAIFLYPWAVLLLPSEGYPASAGPASSHGHFRGHARGRPCLRLEEGRARLGGLGGDMAPSSTRSPSSPPAATRPRASSRARLEGPGVGAEVLAVPVPVRHRLLRHGVHDRRGRAVRHRPLRRRVPAVLAAPGGPAHGRRHDQLQAGPDPQARLRADGRAEVGHRLRRLRLVGRLLRQLRDGAGHRPDHPGGRVHPGLPAAAGAGARRDHAAAGQDPGPAATSSSTASRCPCSARRARASEGTCPRRDRRARRALPDAVYDPYVGRRRRRLRVREEGPHRRRLPLPEERSGMLFDMAPYITAVDYLGQEPRFEVVYNLSRRRRTRVFACE